MATRSSFSTKDSSLFLQHLLSILQENLQGDITHYGEGSVVNVYAGEQYLS